MRTIRIQSILYEPDKQTLARFFESILNLRLPELTANLVVGDCSAKALASSMLCDFDRLVIPLTADYVFFNKNHGFGKGNNLLNEKRQKPDFLLLLNSDCVLPKDLLANLIGFADARPGYGLVEARQIPLEHPKGFDSETLQTNWCSGCCLLVNPLAFEKVSGFDEALFLYGDDVDLSWRIAAQGFPLYVCPEAYIYHRKELGTHGFVGSEAELLHGTVATAQIYSKFGNARALRRFLKHLHNSPIPSHQEALKLIPSALARTGSATRIEKLSARFGPQDQVGTRAWEYQQGPKPPDA